MPEEITVASDIRCGDRFRMLNDPHFKPEEVHLALEDAEVTPVEMPCPCEIRSYIREPLFIGVRCWPSDHPVLILGRGTDYPEQLEAAKRQSRLSTGSWIGCEVARRMNPERYR